MQVISRHSDLAFGHRAAFTRHGINWRLGFGIIDVAC
jgi:hypothetical protein